ncbi:hypothetical protein [Longimicrobium terrae]|uniref:BIG2 domain-containing protein n=1 Tax=Longimicrobium terrae TaxID=1639882 RepID=A0A841H0T1_9BACT|nr:hypothetical protein [Longimicrobium terrae]MBB4637126.1 hypothetical protein [Longimicrobium terrae]MBB6071613.1 hypothetical protein [Longimicrobium terrae]NNC29970.1 hypothetical protein [Longimicrobium terrae]
MTTGDIQGAEASLKTVARSVAVAMGREEVRAAVRDAMRDSPWDVHQVSLRELMGSPRGAGLLAGAAAAAGETPEVYIARLRALPDLDFSVPSRAQRRAWRGTPGVVVAASVNPEDRTVFGFGSDGQLVAGVGSASSSALVMMINPAEPRGRRGNPQPAGAGAVIQSATDGEIAEQYTWTDAKGHKTVMVPGMTASGGMESLNFGDSTYLDEAFFETNDSGTDLELTFYAKFYRPDGSYLGEWTYQNYSLPYRQAWRLRPGLLLPVLPDSSNAYIQLRIREEDGWANPDEWYGPRVFTWVDRDQSRRLNVSGNSSIYADIELGWVQRSKPVATSVNVWSVTVEQGSAGATSASALDQYGWAIPGTVSSWSSGNSSVASITSSNGSSASLYGAWYGQTNIYATIGGITGSGVVSVVEPAPPACNPAVQICPE